MPTIKPTCENCYYSSRPIHEWPCHRCMGPHDSISYWKEEEGA